LSHSVYQNAFARRTSAEFANPATKKIQGDARFATDEGNFAGFPWRAG